MENIVALLLKKHSKDSRFVNERTNMHLDNVVPVEKEPTPTHFLQNISYCTVKACTTHTIKPANQECTPCLTTQWTLIPIWPTFKTFLIKQGRLTCFAFFEFLISSV